MKCTYEQISNNYSSSCEDRIKWFVGDIVEMIQDGKVIKAVDRVEEQILTLNTLSISNLINIAKAEDGRFLMYSIEPVD